MTSLIMNLLLAVSCWQSLSCEVVDNSRSDLNSSNSNHFPLYLPWPISIARLFFEGSTSIFCVQIWPRQSFYTDCFRIFAALVVDPSSKLPSCILARRFQSFNHHTDTGILYLGQGFFELLIATQAPPHLTPSKLKKPTFSRGIPVCVGNLEKS